MFSSLASYLSIGLLTLFIFFGCNTGTGKQNNEEIKESSMILIPAGEFIMGSKLQTTKPKKAFKQSKPDYVDEYPQRKVYVDAFYIDQYEVTNREYKDFIDSEKLPALPANWKNGTYPLSKEDHPVIFVNWYNSMYYAKWAGKRLPTETEWEKAARGKDGRLWVWGNEYDASKGNFGVNRKDTSPVGSFLLDKSPYNIFDMTGNIKEWTVDWYDAYPGNDYKYVKFGNRYKVVRGSSYMKTGHYYNKSFAMVTHRYSLDPRYATPDVGIRCAKDA